MLNVYNLAVNRKQRNADKDTDPTFDISKYSYIKPTFYTFIERKFVDRTNGSMDVLMLWYS
jgi:hypothetical protein